MAWDKDLEARAIKLANEGYSAAQIAAATGGHVSRGTVIRKMKQVGVRLKGRGGTQGVVPYGGKRQPGDDAPKKRKQMPENWRTHTPDHHKVVAQSEYASALVSAAAEAAAVPPASRVPLVDLKKYQCRWPIGDPTTRDFGFCGKNRHVLFPYCEAHARIAYQAKFKNPPAEAGKKRTAVA